MLEVRTQIADLLERLEMSTESSSGRAIGGGCPVVTLDVR
jgi:hypothetical protein